MTIFKDLMNGLDEVEAFLAAEKTEYQINLSDETDAKSANSQTNLPQTSRPNHRARRAE